MVDNKKLIILFSQDFYKFFYGINLANTIKASNQSVEVFFSGYACNFLKKNWKEFDKEKKFNKIFLSYNCKLDDLFKLSMELKIRFFFCQTSLDLFNIDKNNLQNFIDIKPIGLYSIISKFKNDNIIFI